MEESFMKCSQHNRDWSHLVKIFNGLTFYERFEPVIILILGALIMPVTVIATVHLMIGIGIDSIKQDIFQTNFGTIFTVIIALEFKYSLLVVLARYKNVIRVRSVVMIAPLAVVRKFILRDLNKVSATTYMAPVGKGRERRFSGFSRTKRLRGLIRGLSSSSRQDSINSKLIAKYQRRFFLYISLELYDFSEKLIHRLINTGKWGQKRHFLSLFHC